MTAYGLSKHLFYEDLLGLEAGFDLDAVERPYTTFQLIDPHVQAFRLNLEDVASQLHKREESRRLWADVKRTAAGQGVSPGEAFVGMGLHRNKTNVSEFNPVFEEMKARSEQERLAEIEALQERVSSNNAAAAREIEEALAKPRSITDHVALNAKGAAEHVGRGVGGFLSGSGMVADATGWVAGKTTEGAVHATSDVAAVTAEVMRGAGKVVANLGVAGAELMGFEVDTRPRNRTEA